MTEALRKIVEAMRSDVARQIGDASGSPDVAAHELARFDGLIDLEKVARAALNAAGEVYGWPRITISPAGVEIDTSDDLTSTAE